MPTPLEIRIKNIQKTLKVPQTATFDLATCAAVESLLNVTVAPNTSLTDHKKAVQKALGFTGTDIDGVVGGGTITRLEGLLSKELPALPPGGNMVVSKDALNIIINSEVGSKAAYQKTYKFPVWPGGDSGVTIGIGYDMGYASPKQFASDWGTHLAQPDANVLNGTCGLKGTAARNALTAAVKKIEVPWESALEVFYATSMPSYAKDTKRIWPGVEKLPPGAQGALLSLVYNRGAGTAGDSRREMRNIAGWVAQGNLKKIADEIRAMKRLWVGKGLDGLLKRRDMEADMVENAHYFMPPGSYVII